MKTAVTMLGEAFRQWQRDWDNYDNGIGFKPPSYEQFINPYLEKEKEQIQKAFSDGQETPINHPTLPHYSREEYYDDNYKPETI
jgi:hypothetical protein